MAQDYEATREALEADRIAAHERGERLSPALRVRPVTPHCCATCRHLFIANGTLECTRPKGPVFDTGDRLDLYTVCDRWMK